MRYMDIKPQKCRTGYEGILLSASDKESNMCACIPILRMQKGGGVKIQLLKLLEICLCPD